MSNNISFKYLFDQQNMNAKHAIWLSFLSEYDFEIKHIKGNENKVVNALSRNAIMNFITSISIYKIELDDKLEEGIKMDKEYQNRREKIIDNESGNVKTNCSLNEKYLMLYKNKLYVPNIPEIKLLILNEVHKDPYFGHPGYQNMITMLRK